MTQEKLPHRKELCLQSERTIPNRYRSFFRALPGLESSMSTLRSGPRSPRSPGPRAPSRAFFIYSGSLDFTGLPLFLCLHEVVDSWFYNECG